MRLVISLLIMLSVSPARALDAGAATFEDYATCAVYFRMVVGGMRSRGASALASIEQEKMDRMIEMAKGKAAAGEDFNAAWRRILADMTDTINRNYQNVSRLKYRYDDRCETLLSTSEN